MLLPAELSHCPCYIYFKFDHLILAIFQESTHFSTVILKPNIPILYVFMWGVVIGGVGVCVCAHMCRGYRLILDDWIYSADG